MFPHSNLWNAVGSVGRVRAAEVSSLVGGEARDGEGQTMSSIC